MRSLELIVILVSALALAFSNPLYSIVRLVDNSTAYLLLNRVAKQLRDDPSVVTLGFNPSRLENVTLQFLNEHYKIGTRARSLQYKDKSPDDIMRIEILKSELFNGALLKKAEPIGNYINPCIVKWQNRFLLATGLTSGVAGSRLKPSSNTVNICWWNSTVLPFHTTEPYLGIYNEIEDFNPPMLGQDPRIVLMDDPDKFQMFFTNPYAPKVRMGMSEIAINRSTDSFYVVRNYHTIYPTEDHSVPQKNWAPFRYRQEVLLIQSINPFKVMKFSVRATDNTMIAFRESLSPAIETGWPYGELRGGTNAVYIPHRNVYLGVFHSAEHALGNFMKTYVMGVYTFTADPPFRLISISPFPIMPSQFYTGPWHGIRQRQIDYCLFPMSLFIEDETMFVSAGHQDSIGYLLHFNLHEVLETLVSV